MIMFENQHIMGFLFKNNIKLFFVLNVNLI